MSERLGDDCIGYHARMSMNMPMQPGTSPFDTADTTVIATFARYEGAQRAVDALSDSGFDVARSAIVWNGLKRVEYVVGRQTVASAAVKGAAAGAWFAGFFGLLVALFVDTKGFAEAAGIVASYLIIGALIGAMWFAFAHWQTRGRRDFASVGTFEAETYDVRVPTDQRADAERILGVARSSMNDPTAVPGSVPPPPPVG